VSRESRAGPPKGWGVGSEGRSHPCSALLGGIQPPEFPPTRPPANCGRIRAPPQSAAVRAAWVASLPPFPAFMPGGRGVPLAPRPVPTSGGPAARLADCRPEAN